MKNILYFVSFVFTSAFSARILGVIPTPSYSHQVVFQSLWRELSLRGHQVTVLTTDPVKDPSLTNLTEIDLHFSYEKIAQLKMAGFANMTFLAMMDFVVNFTKEMMAEQFEHPPVRELIQNEKVHFDVVIAEASFTSPYAFAVRFKCPLVAITPVDSPNRNYQILGNPVHPALNPDCILPFSGTLNFFQRAISVFWTVYDAFIWGPKMLSYQQELIERYFGKDYPTLSEIERNVSMLFVNSDSIFHRIRPRLPNIIEVGGGIHLKPSKPLSKDLQKLLDGANQGFIYFSLGSNVKSKDLSDETRKIIMETFSELEYLVLWKFELDNLPGKPDNVVISKWFPQQDIFRHPNIKLFITQGGLQSTEEALHNHVPLIAMPFMGDQQKNAQEITDKGLGIQLDIHSLNKDILKNSILEVLGNSKYHENVRHLANLIKDQPMTGLEKAVWWTEYVIRHKGAKHFRSPAMDLPTYQYFLLDVIGFCTLIISIVVFILYKFMKLLRYLIGFGILIISTVIFILYKMIILLFRLVKKLLTGKIKSE